MRLAQSAWRRSRTYVGRFKDQYRSAYGRRETERREAAIRALPRKQWKGRTVYRLLCAADFGKGPHEVWLEEWKLWCLIDLRHFRCPYHR